ncbi:MAG: transglutaminase domain-containing protein [Oscillospiraceae bacterium]|jgi:hypothetical protein
MKRRIAALILSASLMLSLTGCGMFKKEYLSVTKYEDAVHTETASTLEATDYAELTRAVESFVRGHKTLGRIKLASYKGTVQTDLTQACQEVKTQNALASYAVNYMSTDLSRVANYYEAIVYISYRHTQNEIDAVRWLSDKSGLQAALAETLSELGTYTAFKLISPSITAEDVRSAVLRAYTADPASCVVQPEITVRIYPDSGTLRFVEVELEYGWRTSELQKMKSTLLGRISQISGDLGSAKGPRYALDAFNALAQGSRYSSDTGGETLASTAYGALVSGQADSRGLALAFSALCAKGGIACSVVDGTLDGAAHSWNLVQLDGAWYHVDVSQAAALGAAGAFMRTDAEMSGRYAWDTTAWPMCTTERAEGILAG